MGALGAPTHIHLVDLGDKKHLAGERGLPAGGNIDDLAENWQVGRRQRTASRPKKVRGHAVGDKQRLVGLVHDKLRHSVEILCRMLPDQYIRRTLKFYDFCNCHGDYLLLSSARFPN